MKCIFCNDEINEFNFSKEHIIPKFLGGTRVIVNVCNRCNEYMGSGFEKELSENIIIQFIQTFYGMKNRRSKKFISPDFSFELNQNSYFGTDDEGHPLILYKPLIDENSDKIIVDQMMSRDIVDKMIEGKLTKLCQENVGKNVIFNIHSKKILHYGIPEEFSFELNGDLLIKLLIKIAYEFTASCLDLNYLEDEQLFICQDIIIQDNMDSYDIEEIILDFNKNNQKLNYIVNNVIQVAKINTINVHHNNELIYPSGSDFSHKVSLIKQINKLIVDIDLFDIIKAKVCVSKDVSKFDFSEGEICNLIVGIKNDEQFNEFNTKYPNIRLN